MKKFSGIIFDIDGTLTSTNQLIFDSFNHITEKYLSRTYTPEEIIGFFGPTENYIIEELIPDNHDHAKRDYYEYYRANHKAMANSFPGINDLLKNIKDKGTLLSIYTGKGRGSSIITLEETELIDHFDMIVTGDDIEGFKPSPEGITVFLDKYNLPGDDVLMIGDAPSDVKASRDAGVQVATVLWESYAKDTGFWKESDYAFHTVEELTEFLLPRV